MPRAASHFPPPPLTGPLVLWLLPQLLMLGACAAGFLFSRAQPQPADRLALHLVISAQVIVLFLLFPMLLESGRSAAVIFAGASPFWVAAMILSGLGWSTMLSAAGYVLLWLIALHLVKLNLKTPAAQLHACTITSTWLGVGPLLWYLRTESGFSAGLSVWSPLTAALALLNDPAQIAPFMIPLAVGLLAGLVFLIRRRAIVN